MKEVTVHLKVNDYTIKTKGFLNNNILSFYDNDNERTNIIYDYNQNLLIRDNSNLTIKIYFQDIENNVEYTLKKEKIKLNDKLDNYTLQKLKTKVIINYKLAQNNFELELFFE